MEAKLDDINALNIVTGRITDDQVKGVEEKSQFVKANTKAYTLIVQNLDESHLALVSTTLLTNKRFNGSAFWTLLCTKYAGNDLAARSAALNQFLDLEFSSVEKFCPAIWLSNQKMVLASIRLNYQVKILLMFRKLPKKEFRSFRDVVAMGFSRLRTRLKARPFSVPLARNLVTAP